MPTGGRRSSSSVPAWVSSNTRSARRGSDFAGRGEGSASIRPSRRATQSAATGQPSHAGRVRVQTVAPRSINPCV